MPVGHPAHPDMTQCCGSKDHTVAFVLSILWVDTQKDGPGYYRAWDPNSGQRSFAGVNQFDGQRRSLLDVRLLRYLLWVCSGGTGRTRTWCQCGPIITEYWAYKDKVQIFTDSSTRSWMLFSFSFSCKQGGSGTGGAGIPDQTRIPRWKMMSIGIHKYLIYCPTRLCPLVQLELRLESVRWTGECDLH